jgi:acyl-CoA reductase LuxC
VVGFRGRDDALVRAFLSADCVVATGSDATIEAVAARMAPHQALVRHGHALSLAVLGPSAGSGAALDEAARGIALDTALWDQQGCLSPISVYAMGDTEAAGRVGNALAHALAEIEGRLPRGGVEPSAAALAAQERAGAELRAAAGQAVSVRTAPDGRWTVVVEPDAAPRPAPLYRFLRVHAVPDREALVRAIAPLSRHLAAVALDGFGAEMGAVAAELQSLGSTRICAPGSLQCPPLDWARDGLRPLASLAKGIQD